MGSSTLITTIDVPFKPSAVAVNPSTNRIYLTHYFLHSVSVVDGASNTVIAAVGLGPTNPTSIAVDSATDRVYVTSFADNTQGGFLQGVSVIDGTPGSPSEHTVVVPFITVGNSPGSVGINSATNRIYVGNQGGSGFPPGNTVSVIGCGPLLDEIRGGLGPPPGRLVQQAVDRDLFIDPDGSDAAIQKCGLIVDGRGLSGIDGQRGQKVQKRCYRQNQTDSHERIQVLGQLTPDRGWRRERSSFTSK